MTRVRIHFVREDLWVEAPVGSHLVDVATASGADLTFGCRLGSCGTCRVFLRGGPGAASPPTPEERAYLSELGAPEGLRLACQVRVFGDLDVEGVP